MTGDFRFADIRNYPPAAYPGVTALGLPGDTSGAFILHLIRGFVRQTEIVARLPGRLDIIEAGRIRRRPA